MQSGIASGVSGLPSLVEEAVVGSANSARYPKSCDKTTFSCVEYRSGKKSCWGSGGAWSAGDEGPSAEEFSIMWVSPVPSSGHAWELRVVESDDSSGYRDSQEVSFSLADRFRDSAT